MFLTIKIHIGRQVSHLFFLIVCLLDREKMSDSDSEVETAQATNAQGAENDSGSDSDDQHVLPGGDAAGDEEAPSEENDQDDKKARLAEAKAALDAAQAHYKQVLAECGPPQSLKRKKPSSDAAEEGDITLTCKDCSNEFAYTVSGRLCALDCVGWFARKVRVVRWCCVCHWLL